MLQSKMIGAVRAACVVLALLVLSSGAEAATKLIWNRNADSDVSHYTVYACFTKGCVVTRTTGMKQPGSIVQPAVGVIPDWLLPLDKEGTLAVSATDTSGNESGISVPVPFDSVAPAIPVNPQLQ